MKDRVCLRNARVISAASAQRLSWGLVRKAPSASRGKVFWIVLSRCTVPCTFVSGYDDVICDQLQHTHIYDHYFAFGSILLLGSGTLSYVLCIHNFVVLPGE